jgi:hypothetical protein
MTRQKRDFAVAVGAIILTVIHTFWLIHLSAAVLNLAQAIGRMK